MITDILVYGVNPSVSANQPRGYGGFGGARAILLLSGRLGICKSSMVQPLSPSLPHHPCMFVVCVCSCVFFYARVLCVHAQSADAQTVCAHTRQEQTVCSVQCVGLCVGMCVGRCVGRCIGRCIDRGVGRCVDRGIGRGIGRCIGRCVGRCFGGCVGGCVVIG